MWQKWWDVSSEERLQKDCLLSWVHSSTCWEERHLPGCEVYYCEISMIRNWYLWTTVSKGLGLPTTTAYVSEHEAVRGLWNDCSSIWCANCRLWRDSSQRHSVYLCQILTHRNWDNTFVVCLAKFWSICYTAWINIHQCHWYMGYTLSSKDLYIFSICG